MCLGPPSKLAHYGLRSPLDYAIILTYQTHHLMKFIPITALVLVVVSSLVWDKVELRREMELMKTNTEQVQYGPAI